MCFRVPRSVFPVVFAACSASGLDVSPRVPRTSSQGSFQRFSRVSVVCFREMVGISAEFAVKFGENSRESGSPRR